MVEKKDKEDVWAGKDKVRGKDKVKTIKGKVEKKVEEKDKKKIKEKKEVIAEESKDEEEETLEEIVEQEYFEEIDHSRLRNFLMNQQKDVALDQIAISPVVSLESDLPQVSLDSGGREDENIDYNLFAGAEEGKYISSSGVTIDNPHWNEDEKKLEEQKRLYENPMKLRGDKMDKEDLGMKYVRAEDTIKEDYAMKKRFGE